MHKLNEWEEKGYARAIAICTLSQTPTDYPTQDSHTLTAEQDFIRGFSLGMKEFNNGRGIETAAAYIREKAENKK